MNVYYVFVKRGIFAISGQIQIVKMVKKKKSTKTVVILNYATAFLWLHKDLVKLGNIVAEILLRAQMFASLAT